MPANRSYFLFGDSTESTLQTNFLEFLRDSIDFSVSAIQSDLRIEEIRARVLGLRAEAHRQKSELEAFVGSVHSAIEGAPKEADSPTAHCAGHITSLANEAKLTFVNFIEAKLQADLAQADADENSARNAAALALAHLLAPYEPPDSTSTMKIGLGSGGVYQGEAEGNSPPLALTWSLALAAPENHLWAQPVRVERFMVQVDIQVPQVSGWLSKGTKLTSQRIDRFVITEFSNAGGGRGFHLRNDALVEAGFNVTIDAAGTGVRVTRLGAEDGPNGEIEVAESDVAKLVELGAKIEASLTGLHGAALHSATVGDISFRELPAFQAFVETLVARLAPTTRIIAERSLLPTELVIRKLLSNDRREEIFVAKAVLREKFAPLPESRRSLFTPLGLDAAPTTANAPSGVSMRAELAQSRPPPPMQVSASIPVPLMPPSRVPTFTGAPSAPSTAPTDTSVAQPAGTEGLKATMRRIVGLAKSGDTESAYRDYARLFGDSAFAANRLEDQRSALKFLVLAKLPTDVTEALREAFGAALPRVKSIVELSHEPGDYELLGACHLGLSEKSEAETALKSGLALERERNPQSDLCANLTRRLAEATSATP